MKVENKFLLLPLGYDARGKKLCLYRGEEAVFEADMPLDPVSPDYEIAVDLSAYRGEELRLDLSPEIDFVPRFADAVPEKAGVYREKYRPKAHFSAKRGWINDPNGLVYDGSRYHLFFQHNPYSHRWSNMTWGHAVSGDLLTWEEKALALMPDELGTMFSGSAVMDYENRSGLGRDGKGVMLLFYTAAGGTSRRSKDKKFTQCLAFSRDGGETFEKYAGNPVVVHREAENRDPKVIYVPELSAYVMALYLNDNRYALYTSDDFLHWAFFQELTLSGDSECPDLYPLTVEGSDETYWVLSGASDRYQLGVFTKEGFQPKGEAGRLHYGSNSYAAQTFSDIPVTDGRRLRIAWNTMQTPGTKFCCSMCTPCEMALKKIDGKVFLTALPIAEYKRLFCHEENLLRTGLTVGKTLLSRRAPEPQWLACSLTLSEDALLSLSLFGERLEIDAGKDTLSILGSTMPLCRRDGTARFILIADTNGFEIYADAGQAFLCKGFLADFSLSRLELTIQRGEVKELKAHLAGLKSIWP